MTSNYLISTILMVTAVFGLRVNESKNLPLHLDWSTSLIMCHDESIVVESKCVGSAYCSACTNCSRCNWCNSGGSCGVCAAPVRTSKPKIKYKRSTPSKSKSRSNSSSSRSSKAKPYIKPSFESKPKEVVPNSTPIISTNPVFEESYLVQQATSLRALPDSQSKVLMRFKGGEKVILEESPKGPWWKVSYHGKIGWVKQALLKKQ